MGSYEEICEVARHRLEVEGNAVLASGLTIDMSFFRAASRILSCQGKLFTGGSGPSGAMMRRMARISPGISRPTLAICSVEAFRRASGALTGLPPDLEFSQIPNLGQIGAEK